MSPSHSLHTNGPPSRVQAARLFHTSAFGGYSALRGTGFETRLPPHVHTNYVLGLIEAGAVRVSVDGTSWLAEPGMLVLLSPFTVHTELPVTPGGWSFRYLYPSERVVREALGTPSAPGPSLPFARPVMRDVALAATLRRVLDGLEGEWRTPRITDDLVALVRQLREDACRAVDARVDPARQEIRAVRALITGAPLRGVRLADLAAAAGLSQFHFSRVFKAEVGLPPYAFFEQVRIAYAHDLIHQGHDLASVAFQLGYADQSHLTRQFHKGSFTTPGRYAQMTRMNLGGTKGRTGSTL